MAIPSKQIGQSAEANLLWQISKQLDNLKKTATISDPALLTKLDELISVTSQVEINAESINLNTDELESLITESNLLLEEIKTNTANSAIFDGQLTQNGSDVSDTNPLPVSVGDTLPLPTGAATSANQDAINSSLGTINTTLGSPMQQTGGSVSVDNFPASQAVTGSFLTDAELRASAVPVSATSLPLPTGAATSDLQTSGNSSLTNIDKNTVIFYTEDIEEDTSTSTTYIGKQSNSGTWLVQKVVESTVGTINTTLIEYATVLNNPTVLTYTNAWSGRATLIYSQIKNLL